MRPASILPFLVLLWLAPSAVAATCGSGAYAYAGLQSSERASGIRATLALLDPPSVAQGHVAAWVGVGGRGLGPGGTDVWLQAGIATFAGRPSRVYYELVRPGRARSYVELGPPVRRGERVRLAVLEHPRRPGLWRVLVDGRVVLRAAALPGSHGRFRPVATAESWSGTGAPCNRFAFRFDALSAATADGDWAGLPRPYALASPGYRLIRLGGGSFVARDDEPTRGRGSDRPPRRPGWARSTT